MNNLNLLLLEDVISDVELVKRLLDRAGIAAKVDIVKNKTEFQIAIKSEKFDAILVSDSVPYCSPLDALNAVSDRGIGTPLIIIIQSLSEEYVANLIKSGADDYVLKAGLERLPIALLNAIEKYTLKQEQEAFFNELVARKTLMKDAERLAHFGSWKEDIVNDSLYWSDEKYRILGYEPGTVLPSWEGFYKKVHPDDRDFVRLTIEDAVNFRNRQKFTFRIGAPGDPIKYIHSEIFVTRDADLKVVQLNGFIRDISEHTEAEIKLVESEEKYRNLFENNPTPLCVIEMGTGRYLDVNKAAIDQYGYSREEFLSLTTDEIVMHDYQHDRNVAIDDYPVDQGKKGVWRNRRKDGSVIQVEVTTSDIIFEGKKCRLVIYDNISDKLAAINQLKESEARLMASQRIGHIGSWEVVLSDKEENNVINWTDETYRIFGYSPSEARATSEFFNSILHPEDKDLVAEALDATSPENPEFSVEFRTILRDGSERIVRELGEVIFDEHTGRKVKITGTAQDITERKMAAELLQKSEANLRSIFENTETAYVLLDMQLQVVSFNQPAYKFSQKHLDKTLVEGTYAVSYFSEARQAVVRKSLKDAMHGMNLNYEVNYEENDGTNKWYYAHFHPVWSDDKVILGVIMSLRDITERKTSELQEKKITSDLIRRNKDLEQFAYIISHNLRAPVANILGISEALNEGGLSEEDKTVFAEGLSSSVKKLDNVITDLNRILQMKHEVNENKEAVLFSQIVEDIRFSIGGMTENEMFQINCDFDEVDEMITLKSYMHSIFYNLISNSLKYKKPEITPVIDIRSRKLDKKIELVFKDNGLGIDLEKNKEQLFGLYKRFHQKAAEGKGMGLFMVKTQVETLDGKISIQSKVNEGTQFTMEFEIAGSIN